MFPPLNLAFTALFRSNLSSHTHVLAPSSLIIELKTTIIFLFPRISTFIFPLFAYFLPYFPTMSAYFPFARLFSLLLHIFHLQTAFCVPFFLYFSYFLRLLTVLQLTRAPNPHAHAKQRVPAKPVDFMFQESVNFNRLPTKYQRKAVTDALPTLKPRSRACIFVVGPTRRLYVSTDLYNSSQFRSI